MTCVHPAGVHDSNSLKLSVTSDLPVKKGERYISLWGSLKLFYTFPCNGLLFTCLSMRLCSADHFPQGEPGHRL